MPIPPELFPLIFTGPVLLFLLLLNIDKNRKYKAQLSAKPPVLRLPPEVKPVLPVQQLPVQPNPPPLTDVQMIERVVTHIAFATKTVLAGQREIGTRIVEYRLVESAVPADEWDVRPVRGPADQMWLLPSERTKPVEIALLRLLSGEALAAQHYERRAIHEPIYEPVYRAAKQAVYVLLDVSPSMFGEGQPDQVWRIGIAKGVVRELLSRAMDEQAIFYLRCFGQSMAELKVAKNKDEAVLVEDSLLRAAPIAGTDITRALQLAITDCSAQAYDETDIMIVTDGEDNQLNAGDMQAALKQAKIRLHAILLGTQNAALRRCAHMYQEIPERGRVLPPIQNAV